ncbi:aldehyde dehydrogenase family protein [Bradyrhizobium sp. 14AA]
MALVAFAKKAGEPKGVFNIVTADSRPIGKGSVQASRRFVGFTGSTEVGKILYRYAAVGVKKLGLDGGQI